MMYQDYILATELRIENLRRIREHERLVRSSKPEQARGDKNARILPFRRRSSETTE